MVQPLQREIEISAKTQPREKTVSYQSLSRIPDKSPSIKTEYGELGFHAKGGLGTVFTAEDQELHRNVAIKFIHKRLADDPESRARFQLEAEVTGRLEHPGIVPVYGVGHTADSQPFYVMRFIRGETLEAAIGRYHQTEPRGDEAERVVSFHNLLSRFVSVCNTVAYAHNRGILHRDIKPDNVILGKYGETVLVDWGLAMPVGRDERARSSGEETLLPKFSSDSGDSSGRGAGTPAYMSPEVAAGRTGIEPTSDIYSLGAMLYRLLTGANAFHGTTVNEVMEKVEKGQFLAPSKVNHSAPAALDAICLKAMAADPDARYSTALDLAAAVECWLADEPIAAYREPWKQQLVRWKRHHRGWTQVIVATVVAVVVSATVWVTGSWNHRHDLADHNLEDLKVKAGVEEAMLLSDFRDLKQDVRFLATRPQVGLVSNPALSEAETDRARRELTESFRDFISLKPSYMQARLIARSGMELVRVERAKPGDPVHVAPKLRDKSAARYFNEAMILAEGEVYLSKLELNVEDGEKDWEFPVIRAAVPVAGAGGQPGRIVIINMHFSHLAELVQLSRTEDLVVYLTNDKGDFLLHPTPGIGFCFERQLVFPVETTYPQLAPFLLSDDRDIKLRSVEPILSALVEPTTAGDMQRPGLRHLVAAVVNEHPTVHPRRSEEDQNAILIGLEGGQLRRVRELIERDFKGEFIVHELPPRYEGARQMVYSRKVFFDDRRPHRFINLIMVLPAS